MSTHTVDLSLPGPFEDDHLERLTDFFEANGYVRVADQGGAPVFERGERGAGWWSSAMTDLWTQVRAEICKEKLTLHYTVDVEGQRLSDEDRKFWSGEAEHLRGHLRGGPLYDLRQAEQQRAKRTRGRTVYLSLVGAFAAFCIILALRFIGII